MIKTFKRCAVLLLTIGLLWSTAMPIAFAAAPPVPDREAIDLDSVHYKTDYLNNSINCSNLSSTVPSSPAGPVYFLGDSIGTQIQNSLQGAFAADGWSYQGSALSSRTLSGGSVTPDGLSQIDTDAAYIRTAKAIIIELGTNAGGFTAETVGQAIDKMRGLAPTANIYWVDTAVVSRSDYAPALNAVNKIIQEQAAAKNYEVLSWNKTVFGTSADPTNMDGQQDINNYISTSDGLNVHLTDIGVTAMSDLIINSVKGALPTDAAGTCTCTIGGGNLPGADNREKAWWFFIGKGLTPVQAAGILGNFQRESNFDPSVVNSIGAYGLAQWLGGRKDNLAAYAVANNLPMENLELQLNFAWEELNNAYKTAVLDPILATTDLFTVVDTFTRKYEIPGNYDTEVPIRFGYAETILAELGASTTPGSGSASESGCVGGGEELNLVVGDTLDIPCFEADEITDYTPPGGAEGYQNGQLYLIRICRVYNTVVNSQVSKQVYDMYNTARTAGINLSGGGFRYMTDQIAVYQSWCDINNIAGSPPPYPKPPGQTIRCPGGGAPGYSNHQMGFAIDVTCDGRLIQKAFPEPGVNKCFDWLLANASLFGFFEYSKGTKRGTSGYEAWHWSVNGS